jgi:hypothetical protein
VELTGLLWHRRGTGGGAFVNVAKNFGLHKMRGNT